MQSWDGCQCARVSFRWVALKTERPQDRGPHRICGPWANTMSTSQRGSGRTHASLAPTTPVRRNTSWRSIPVTFTENLWSVINGTYYYYLFLLTCFLPLSHGFLRVAEFYSKVISKNLKCSFENAMFWDLQTVALLLIDTKLHLNIKLCFTTITQLGCCNGLLNRDQNLKYENVMLRVSVLFKCLIMLFLK